MNKNSVLSPKYVSKMKWCYFFCLVFTAACALVFALLPFFAKLPAGSGSVALGCVGLMTTLSVLFSMRYNSLLENDAIYRAITKQTEENTNDSK
jgi:hypothetical protein